MEKKENGKAGGKRTVKDLTVKSTAAVKGGATMPVPTDPDLK